MPVRDVTAVRINVCYNRFKRVEDREPTEDEIYQIARWAWKRLCPQQLVFACVKGRIRGVYEVVGKWYWCGEARRRSELQPDYPNAPKFQEIRIREIEGNIEKNDRRAFVGCRAACANQFLGRCAEDFGIRFTRFNPVTRGRVNVN